MKEKIISMIREKAGDMTYKELAEYIGVHHATITKYAGRYGISIVRKAHKERVERITEGIKSMNGMNLLQLSKKINIPYATLRNYYRKMNAHNEIFNVSERETWLI